MIKGCSSIVVLATALSLFLPPAPSAAGEKVSWDYATYGRPRAITAGSEKLAEYVKEKTNGDFTITMHWGTLAQPKELLDGISIGAFQGAYYAASFNPGKTPIATVLDLPFLPIDSYDQAVRVFEAFRTYKPQIDEMKRWNAMHFMSMVIQSSEIMGKGTPPQSFLDLRGLRLRATAGPAEIIRAMGGSPVVIVPPELQGAMERGLVDGASFPLSNFASYRLHEIAKWYTVGMPTTSAHSATVFNLDVYEKLPAAYKKILEEGRVAGHAAQKEAYDAERNKSVADYKQAGLAEIRISDADRKKMAEKAVKPVWDAWVAELSAKGIDGRAVLDFVITEARKASS